MNNPKVYEINFYGTNYNVVLGKGNYCSNGTVAVLMYECTPKGKIKDVFADLTRNIEDSNVYANKANKQFVDTNNLPASIIGWLEENGIANEVNGICGHSGFCVYPLVEFTQEALDQMFELK